MPIIRKAVREREARLALCQRALLWGPGALNMTDAEIETTIQHLEDRAALLRWALQSKAK